MLKPGQPCRYGHPWNRSADWKRCLTCYPPGITPELRTVRDAAREAYTQRAQEAAVQRTQARAAWAAAGRRGEDWAKARANSIRKLGSLVRAADLRALLVKQNGRCALTHLPLDDVRPSLDHVVPVGRGGTHEIANLQLTHPKANMAKHEGTAAELQDWILAAADSIRARRKLEALL